MDETVVVQNVEIPGIGALKCLALVYLISYRKIKFV